MPWLLALEVNRLPPWLGEGEEFYLQFWQLDPGGPSGFAASNAVLPILDA